MTPPMSINGQQLYEFLPDIYRERDLDTDAENPHLRSYLDAHGALLDRARATLEQFYDDHFPDVPPGDRVCQEWVIPYLAALVGLNPVSPFPDGQRAEVANAIRWNQRKGTRLATDEIAEAIILNEIVVQEGWQRVLTTAALDMPLLPAVSFAELDPSSVDSDSSDDDGIDGFYQRNARRPGAPLPGLNPQLMARHPGLPMFTVDFSRNSRAFDVEEETLEYQPSEGAAINLRLDESLTSQESVFGGSTALWPAEDQPYKIDEANKTPWLQRFRNGIPCFRDSYEDVSRRSVDVHDPRRSAGRGRYHPRRALIYMPPPRGMCADIGSAELSINRLIAGTATSVNDAITFEEDAGNGDMIIRGDPLAAKPEVLIGRLLIDDGKVWRLEHVRFRGVLKVTNGTVILRRCAIETLDIFNPGDPAEVPYADAQDCLFKKIIGNNGALRAEYCTILKTFSFKGIVWASEVIFPKFAKTLATTFECVRYSRVPAWMLLPEDEETPSPVSPATNTADQPVYVEAEYCQPGAGILAPACSTAISAGAEDGGEMGAYHAWRFVAQRDALHHKLQDYLPLGIKPVIVWDARLLCAPPKRAG